MDKRNEDERNQGERNQGERNQGDVFRPQGGALQVKKGHEEVDFSVRMIVVSVVFLVISGIAVLLVSGAIMKALEWAEALRPPIVSGLLFHNCRLCKSSSTAKEQSRNNRRA